jgi:membrane protein YdbS with pleckstrin-like domain
MVSVEHTSGPAEAHRPDLAFRPSGEQWAGVSPQLRRVRRAVLVLTAAPFGVLAAAGLTLLTTLWAGLLLGVVVLALIAWAWVLIGRNVRSWGYAEREQDLLVSHGVYFRQLVVVPYGRMQFVDVSAGPLERRFGIATVQLHTAAAATDARIPGVPPEEAARLRDRLSALGEARLSGL